MKITMTYGSTDTITLTADRNIYDEPSPCLFSGKLTKDQSSLVVVTGCIDSETLISIDISAVSARIIDLFIVNGIAYNVIERKFKRRKRGLENDYLKPPNNMNQLHLSSNDAKLPDEITLETQIGYDNSLLKKFDYNKTKTEQWI